MIEFIDNIATHTIAFEADGAVTNNNGGYTDWLERKKALEENKLKTAKKPATKTNVSTQAATDNKKNKLSFNEQRRLADLPAKVEKLEANIAV